MLNLKLLEAEDILGMEIGRRDLGRTKTADDKNIHLSRYVRFLH